MKRLLDAIGDEQLQRNIRSEVAKGRLGAFFARLQGVANGFFRQILSSRALQVRITRVRVIAATFRKVLPFAQQDALLIPVVASAVWTALLSPLSQSKKGTQIMQKLFNDEAGFVISAELVLVLTIAVLGIVVGLASVRDSINAELVDLSNAFGAIDQSYSVRGSLKSSNTAKPHAQVAGFGFADRGDDCDCKPIEYVDVCGKRDSSNGAVAEGNQP